MKNEREHKEDKKEDDSLLHSIKIRENFSLEDINNILGQMDQVMAEYRASLQGIDVNQMVKTIRGGNVVWITIDEMNAILSKKRALFAKKHKKNAESIEKLSDKIQQRLSVIQDLVLLLKKADPGQYPEFSKKRRKLEIVQNHVHSVGHEIRILENAIQRKKKEAQAIQEVNSATSSILEGIKDNDLSGADMCRSYCERHMEDYLIQHKRIEPYQKKMKESQLIYLQSKQNGYEQEYIICSDIFPIFFRCTEEIIYFDHDDRFSQNIVSTLQDIMDLINTGKDLFVQLTSLDVLNSNECLLVFDKFDERVLMPLYERAAGFIMQFNTAWDTLNLKKSPENTGSAVKPRKNISTKMIP